MKTPWTKISRRAAAAVAASICSCLFAQTFAQTTPTPTHEQPPSDGAKAASLSHHDRAFLKKAAAAGMKEIDISRAVFDRLSNRHAKDLAQMMVTDHTAAGEELATLAASKGVALPDEDVSVSADWAKKTGDLDRVYAKAMVADHMDAVKLFENATQSGDPDIAAFARKTLPTLQHHLSMALDLAKDVN
jgi:putative membrane protein